MTKKIVKKKINPKPKKQAKKEESIYEAVRHLGYYDQINTSYKNVFVFGQLAQIMLFIANFFNGNMVGTIAVILSVGLSYISQKYFHENLQKKGSIFQRIALGFAVISGLALCCPHFYQL